MVIDGLPFAGVVEMRLRMVTFESSVATARTSDILGFQRTHDTGPANIATPSGCRHCKGRPSVDDESSGAAAAVVVVGTAASAMMSLKPQMRQEPSAPPVATRVPSALMSMVAIETLPLCISQLGMTTCISEKASRSLHFAA